MKTIAYYISDYGFGHVTRSTALIRQLLQCDDTIHIIVNHSYGLDFLRKALVSDRVSFRERETDIGFFLKEGSIQPDRERLRAEYEKYIAAKPSFIKEEIAFLQSQRVDAVVSDIFPWPFEAAKAVGLPGIGVSNFTWYTAYLDLLTEEELTPLKEAYQCMSAFIEIEPCVEPTWADNVVPHSFFARAIDAEEVNRIRQNADPTGTKQLIYFGLGMKIDAGRLDELPLWSSDNCHFIVAWNTDVDGPNITKIPRDYLETQNYVAAADLAISKPGWSTVAEALTAQVPLLLVEREGMREDAQTIAYLRERQLCHTVRWEQLREFKIDDALLQSTKAQQRIEVQQEARDIAVDILRLIN
ncbi:hypothetical protein EJF36_18275 [Bacillus sp. HMF5848]|uniref:glycosyltransferase n=1 Tax=Bacillus sp. HMF5848 TaxID=2495421 RepID=UPI000F7779A6|nr:glycosyltransferase [Bacillus sp. HMF5848]RSK28656.1 hypothetical protein EJF36_18275 [Bacillus sp. HMF5848]